MHSSVPLLKVVALLLLCAATADVRQPHFHAARSFAATMHAAYPHVHRNRSESLGADLIR